MKNKKPILGLIFIPPMLAIFLGWIDHETQSLSHLFSTPGNIVALVFYTILFLLVGCLLIGFITFLKELFSKEKHTSS